MHYTTRAGPVQAIENVSFTLEPGSSLGLVGESGCGKTSVALTLLRLMPDNAKIITGEIWLGQTEILGLSDEDMRQMRWDRIAMVFQAAMNARMPPPILATMPSAVRASSPILGCMLRISVGMSR